MLCHNLFSEKRFRTRFPRVRTRECGAFRRGIGVFALHQARTGKHLSGNQASGGMDSGDISPEKTTEERRGRARLENRHTALSGKQRIHQTFSWRQRIALIGGLFPRSLRPTDGSGASGSPFLESRSSSVGQFDSWFRNSDLQSEFSMLSYSYWQNMMHCCIILTVNLLTWRKVSPVFYWKTEPFIPAHDTTIPNPHSFLRSFLQLVTSFHWYSGGLIITFMR